MFHHVARAEAGTLLFRTWAEGAALWRRLEAVPGLEAACLMPDHVHVVSRHADHGPIWRAKAGYARERNERRGTQGGAWQRSPPPEPLPDASHVRRTVRYVHLNPCRARLVDDPLAWPFSTHRAWVGLGLGEPRAEDPARFHAYVSGDPAVRVEGTELPYFGGGPVTWAQVVDAVCGLRLLGADAVTTRGPARKEAVQLAFLVEAGGAGDIASWAGLHRTRVAPHVRGLTSLRGRGVEPAVRRAAQVIGDPRFFALPAGDVRAGATWARYRRLR